MVQYQRLDYVFKALADPTRRGMLQRLADREHRIGELAAPLSMSFAAASKHLRVLEAAGLIRRRIEGRVHLCSLVPAPLAEADAWLRAYEHHWTERFDALEQALTVHETKTQEDRK